MPQPPVKPENLLGDKEFQLIGMIRDVDDIGTPIFRNIVITLKDGKVVKVGELQAAYSEPAAINDAVSWIDNHYWRL